VPSAPAAAVATAIAARPVQSAGELAEHLRIRRQIFVGAQGLFDGDDRDERDGDPATIHVVGLVDGAIAGAVRLYPLDDASRPTLWQGDRLAVIPQARALQLGADLVRCAVALAGAAGGGRMVALVQSQNVRFFERLGWQRDGAPALHHGIEHQPMAIALTAGEALSPPRAA
jgi:putative N-acetyltransferase (TIGR04045 family)